MCVWFAYTSNDWNNSIYQRPFTCCVDACLRCRRYIKLSRNQIEMSFVHKHEKCIWQAVCCVCARERTLCIVTAAGNGRNKRTSSCSSGQQEITLIHSQCDMPAIVIHVPGTHIAHQCHRYVFVSRNSSLQRSSRTTRTSLQRYRWQHSDPSKCVHFCFILLCYYDDDRRPTEGKWTCCMRISFTNPKPIMMTTSECEIMRETATK